MLTFSYCLLVFSGSWICLQDMRYLRVSIASLILFVCALMWPLPLLYGDTFFVMASVLALLSSMAFFFGKKYALPHFGGWVDFGFLLMMSALIPLSRLPLFLMLLGCFLLVFHFFGWRRAPFLFCLLGTYALIHCL
jgi:hypothetical protein